jgi:hypothetical protein
MSLNTTLFRNRPQTAEYRPSRPLRQLKPQVDQLVVKWVTISESWLLIVFAFWPVMVWCPRRRQNLQQQRETGRCRPHVA